MKFWDKVELICWRTRAWAEAEALNAGLGDDLCGMCKDASIKLFKNLKKAGIKSQICLNDCHVFLIIKNKIIDVTATQFGYFYPKIYIKKRKFKGSWKIKYKANTLKTLMKNLTLIGWENDY